MNIVVNATNVPKRLFFTFRHLEKAVTQKQFSVKDAEYSNIQDIIMLIN